MNFSNKEIDKTDVLINIYQKVIKCSCNNIFGCSARLPLTMQ